MIIYILGSEDESIIKIGKTTQRAEVRRRQHERSGNPQHEQALHFLAAVIGMDSDETAIHRYWRSKGYQYVNPSTGRESREWFRAEPDLLDWIRWLRTQHYVARTEDEIDELERVSSETWLPQTQHRLREPMQLQLGTWATLSDPPITGDDFYTDPRLIEAARRTMGGIDMDPASCPEANKVVRAPIIYTFDTNGLEQHWKGRVWCNPPFGKWELWGPKIIAEWRRGDVEQMCVLMSSRAITVKKNAPLIAASDAWFIAEGRFPFWGIKAASPDEGHPIFYFGPNRERFAEEFSRFGSVAFTHKKGQAA